MKKCPYCAELVRHEAVKCKHCQSDLTTTPAHISANVAPQPSGSNPVRSVIRIALWSCLAIAYLIFLLTSPVIGTLILLTVIWLVKAGATEGLRQRLVRWKQHKARLVFSVLAILVAIPFQSIASYPAPVITVTSDTGNQGTNVDYTLAFTASDATKVTVNGQEYQPDENGVYSLTTKLDIYWNYFDIVATNEHKRTAQRLNIEREPTAEEQANYDRTVEQAQQRNGTASTESGMGPNGAYTTPSVCDINSYVAGAVIEGYTKYPDEAKQSCTYATLTSLGNHQYEISGYVIGKNSFGVEGRVYYSATLLYKGGHTNDIDNWELVTGPEITE